MSARSRRTIVGLADREVPGQRDRPDVDACVAFIGGHDPLADDRVQPDLRPQLRFQRAESRAELGHRTHGTDSGKDRLGEVAEAADRRLFVERPQPDEEAGAHGERGDEPDDGERDRDP
jgi:hypothetical protein